MAQHATTLPEQQPTRAARHPRNVSNLERGLSQSAVQPWCSMACVAHLVTCR